MASKLVARAKRARIRRTRCAALAQAFDAAWVAK